MTDLKLSGKQGLRESGDNDFVRLKKEESPRTVRCGGIHFLKVIRDIS